MLRPTNSGVLLYRSRHIDKIVEGPLDQSIALANVSHSTEVASKLLVRLELTIDDVLLGAEICLCLCIFLPPRFEDIRLHNVTL